MRKLIAFLFIIGSLCFGSEFQCYKRIKIEECNDILNDLNKQYKVVSYQIVPYSSVRKNRILYYNLVVQLEEK